MASVQLRMKARAGVEFQRPPCCAAVLRSLRLFPMRFRTYKNSDLRVSEVGFGLWTISTGWWGQFTEGEAIALMRKAFDLGVTFFDAADTYGNGLSEELIAKEEDGLSRMIR